MGKKVIVLVTDGQDNIAPFGADVAPTLKESGFMLATMGIGGFVSKKDLKAIASVPSLFLRFKNYKKFESKVGKIAQDLCTLPADAVPPSPTPSVSGTPMPMSMPTIITKEQISPFGKMQSSMANAGALREAFEFYLGYMLKITTAMRIDVYLESSAHPNFPWNIVNGNGDRFFWPGQTASPSPVIVSDDTVRIDLDSAIVRSLKKCPVKDCAARVQIVAETRINYGEVRKAFKSVKKLPGFSDVFEDREDEDTRIIREGTNSFVIFVAFVDRFDKSG